LLLRDSKATEGDTPPWKRLTLLIFPDKAMTVAAIDRLVHHATILEMNAESFRQRAAASNKKAQDEPPATTTTDNQSEGAT